MVIQQCLVSFWFFVFAKLLFQILQMESCLQADTQCVNVCVLSVVVSDKVLRSRARPVQPPAVGDSDSMA